MEPYPEWNEMVFYRWGYARVQAIDANTLQWDWLDGVDNAVYDRMVITQNVTDSWVLPESDTTTNSDGESDDLSTGALVGIYVAAGIVIAFVSIVVFVAVSRKLAPDICRSRSEMSDRLF